MEIKCPNLEQLPVAVERFLPFLKEYRQILFYGEMGSGKTSFIGELFKQIGVADFNGSPTYSLVNEYDTPLGTFHHLDLYRVEREEELFDIGLIEQLESSDFFLIEWPQLVEDYVDEKHLSLYFSLDAEMGRIISLKEAGKEL
ncbi:MAG: tRNA (adenosine(37)-N6)-threonylcarbamoyltransferase complex ATPase subunit type 1 TsaE [Bacteroidetes bacterium]|nr:MAG: tRNA (adenosine(37)-N6)-threonylcarbamoyltransferase complex ATPase subunit type 1 TsaE [Bacteroidota bacterium]